MTKIITKKKKRNQNGMNGKKTMTLDVIENGNQTTDDHTKDAFNYLVKHQWKQDLKAKWKKFKEDSK
jgi:hypothetical protein